MRRRARGRAVAGPNLAAAVHGFPSGLLKVSSGERRRICRAHLRSPSQHFTRSRCVAINLVLGVDRSRLDRENQSGKLIDEAVTMQKRKLGASGLEVSALGLGCMGVSHGYG